MKNKITPTRNKKWGFHRLSRVCLDYGQYTPLSYADMRRENSSRINIPWKLRVSGPMARRGPLAETVSFSIHETWTFQSYLLVVSPGICLYLFRIDARNIESCTKSSMAERAFTSTPERSGVFVEHRVIWVMSFRRSRFSNFLPGPCPVMVKMAGS